MAISWPLPHRTWDSIGGLGSASEAERLAREASVTRRSMAREILGLRFETQKLVASQKATVWISGGRHAFSSYE